MDHLDICSIRESDITEDMDICIREALVECFPSDRDYFSKQSWWYSVPAWRILVQDEKNRVIGHIALIDRTVRVLEKAVPVRVGGIQGVLVRSKYRGLGLMDKLMKTAMQVASDAGIDLGLLFCSDALLKTYSRCGWQKVERTIEMENDQSETVLMPKTTNTMIYPLKLKEFPAGVINLAGRQW